MPEEGDGVPLWRPSAEEARAGTPATGSEESWVASAAVGADKAAARPPREAEEPNHWAACARSAAEAAWGTAQMPSVEEGGAPSPSRSPQEREVEREVAVLGGPAEAAEVAELRRSEQGLDSREEGEARSEYRCEAEVAQRKPVRSVDSPSAAAAAAAGPPHLVPVRLQSSDQAPGLDWIQTNP